MLNALELHKYLKASADKGNLDIVYEKTHTPRTDGKTVWLPEVNIFTTEESAKILKHYVNHEASHVRNSDFELLKEAGVSAANSPLGALWNLIEDNRIDFQNCIEYEGDRESASYAYNEAMEKLIGGPLQNVPKNKQEMVDFILPALAFDAHSMRDTYYGAGGIKEKLESLMSPQAKKYYDKIKSGKYEEELKRIRTISGVSGSKDTLKLAEKLFKEVYNLDPEEEKKRCKQQNKKDGGNEQGDGAGNDKELKEVVKLGEDKEHGIVNVNYSGLIPSEHAVNSEGVINNKGQHLIYDKSHFENKTSFTQTPLSKYSVKDYTNFNNNSGEFVTDREIIENTGYARYRAGELAKIVNETQFDGFANKVRMRLQIRSKGRTQYGLKEGKLHKGAIHRITLKDVGGLNERVFKNTIKSDVLNTAVQIIVDASGSMSGEKFAHAGAAAALLSNTIGNILRIPCEVLAFTHNRVCEMFVIRDFNTQLLGTGELVKRFVDLSQHTGNNTDGEAILFGYNRIIKRKEKRKVMIVLSDGSPAGGTGDVVGYTNAVIKMIEKESPVQIIGVGIMDHNVEKFYRENKVIKGADELEGALLSLIDKKLV